MGGDGPFLFQRETQGGPRNIKKGGKVSSKVNLQESLCHPSQRC